jgi:hypothetical protein
MNIKKTRKKGGKAVASGGFGCVFNPALKCVNKPRGNGVSKLLFKYDAIDEMGELVEILPILNRIPNKEKYFINVNVKLCDVDLLTEEDKVQFDKKCSRLTSEGINSSNVNSNLDKLSAIQLPYGGLDISRYLSYTKLTPTLFISLNRSLIQLLKHAIIPMNKLGLFHNDLKSGNILCKLHHSTIQTKIIDWGMAFIQRNENDVSIYRHRPFQYNMPFSTCLFHPNFKSYIHEHLTRLRMPLKSMKEELKVVMFQWVQQEYITKYGNVGHYKYFKEIISKLMFANTRSFTNLDKIVEFSYLNNIIADGLTEIVMKYSSNDEFDEILFFNEVYKKNVDIWGFMSVYFTDMVQFFGLEKNMVTLLNKLRALTFKYIFDPLQQANAVDLKQLELDLKKLNNLSNSTKKRIYNE